MKDVKIISKKFRQSSTRAYYGLTGQKELRTSVVEWDFRRIQAMPFSNNAFNFLGKPISEEKFFQECFKLKPTNIHLQNGVMPL
jgi:hypothetical protein